MKKRKIKSKSFFPIKPVLISVIVVLLLFVVGYFVNSNISGQAGSTGSWEYEFELYNNIYSKGSTTGYCVSCLSPWTYVGYSDSGNVGGSATLTNKDKNDFSVEVLPRDNSNGAGTKLKFDSKCANYEIEVDEIGKYYVSKNGKNIDSFRAQLNGWKKLSKRQIAGTNDAISVHYTTSGLSWFVLHCNEEVVVEESSGTDFGYEVKFNWQTGEITTAREYTQDKTITRNAKTYLEEQLQYVPEEAKPYKANMKVGGKIYSQPFQPFMIDIAENFKEDGIINSPSLTKADLIEVSVRFVLPHRLDDREFGLSVTNPIGKLLANVDYRGARTGNELFIEQVALVKSKQKSSETGGRRVKIVQGSDEGNVNHDSDVPLPFCPDLREIYPGHNVLGENRYNMIFIGVGYDRDDLGRPEFVDKLPLVIDYNEVGINTNDGAGLFSTTFDDGHKGLFSYDPFRNNQHLFNFWYTNNIYPLTLEDECEELANGDFDFENDEDIERYEELSSDCKCRNLVGNSLISGGPYEGCEISGYDLLSNINEIYFVNGVCRSNAGLPRWYTFGVKGKAFVMGASLVNRHDFNSFSVLSTTRVMIHELGHSIGGLLDEYTESGFLQELADFFISGVNCMSRIHENLLSRVWPGVFIGCSYDDSNVRSTESSVMKSHSVNDNFEIINELQFCREFASTTGISPFGTCTFPPSFAGSYYSCNSDSECVSGVCDYLKLPNGRMSNIKQCLFSKISWPLSCDVSRQCASGLCRDVGTGDKFCLRINLEQSNPCYYDEQCAEGLQCIRNSCREPRSNGERCEENNDCESNLCQDGNNNGIKTCLAVNLEGNERCIVHEQCLSNRCVEGSEDRKQCLWEVGTAPNDSFCVESSECQSGLCARSPRYPNVLLCLASNLAVEEPCDLDIQCQSFNCQNGECSDEGRRNQVDGALCSSDDECQSGVCRQFQTRRACGESNLPVNTRCERYTQCQSGVCSIQGDQLLTFCRACTSDSQCSEGKSCDGGSCQ